MLNEMYSTAKRYSYQMRIDRIRFILSLNTLNGMCVSVQLFTTTFFLSFQFAVSLVDRSFFGRSVGSMFLFISYETEYAGSASFLSKHRKCKGIYGTMKHSIQWIIIIQYIAARSNTTHIYAYTPILLFNLPISKTTRKMHSPC